MLYEVTHTKHAMLCEVITAKHAWVSLEKIWMGQMGRLEEKIATILLSGLHSFPFGLFNIFLNRNPFTRSTREIKAMGTHVAKEPNNHDTTNTLIK